MTPHVSVSFPLPTCNKLSSLSSPTPPSPMLCAHCQTCGLFRWGGVTPGFIAVFRPVCFSYPSSAGVRRH